MDLNSSAVCHFQEINCSGRSKGFSSTCNVGRNINLKHCSKEKCPFCYYGTNSTRNLRRHVKSRHAENYEKFITPDKSDAVKSVVENQSSYAPAEPISVVAPSRFDQLSEDERKSNEPVSMVKLNRLMNSEALYLIIISWSLFICFCIVHEHLSTKRNQTKA